MVRVSERGNVAGRVTKTGNMTWRSHDIKKYKSQMSIIFLFLIEKINTTYLGLYFRH